jgi:hypothetical protein
MNRELFVRIMNDVEEYDDYFMQRMNATGQFGLRCFQKVITYNVSYAKLWNARRCYR